MNRNDLILALIKALGVFFLASAIIDVPSFLISAITAIVYVIRYFSFENMLSHFVGVFSTFLTIAVKGAIGFYLMGGGKWFFTKASKE